MHRTQLYFDETLYNEIKQAAGNMNITISAYIRDVLRKELDRRKNEARPVDFSEFSGMWKDSDITREELRSKAWK